MNNQIQLVLKSSTTELPLNDREYGIYLVPELEGLTGLPEIRTTSGVNAGYDGGWTSAQNYDARSITIRGVIANEDVATVEQLRRQLTTLAGQGKSEELTLDLVTQAGKAYTIQVRTIALEMSLQKVLTQQEFMLQLRADDPLIYDASETTHEALLQVAQATGGFTIDFELPLAITGSSEETIVNNEGLEQVPTVTRMYGELHNPKIINQTTNQFMQINADLGFAEGDWIEPSEVVSGKDITINGAPEGAPLSSVQIDGNTEQQTYSGKNLVYTSGKTDGGITATYNSATGETTISGKAQRTYAVFGAVADVFPAGTYTFSIQSAAPCAVGVATRTSGGTRQGYPISAGATKTTFTISEASPRYDIYLTGLTTGMTYSFTFKAMLEAGSSATSFEPYVGAVPAPNPNYPQAVKVVTGENAVKIHGKNLLEITRTTPETKNGITVTWEGSSFVLNGTASANTDLYGHGQSWGDISKFYPLLAGTYTMSVRKADMSLGANFAVKMYNNSGTGKRIFDFDAASAGTATSTLDADSGYTNFYISITSGRTFNNERFYVQLEKSSQATEWEDYQEQSYEINLGKNLFDKDNASEVINAYIDTSAHKITTGNYYRLAYIECEPNTTYTVSKIAGKRFRVATTSEVPASNVPTSGEITQDTGTSITITTGSTAKYLCVFCYHASYDTLTPEQILASLQIEKGSQATSYAPYFTPIELCKIGTYQDYIYKSGGKWYVHKEIGHTLYTGNVFGIAANNNSGETTASATGAFFVWGGYAGLMSENLGTLNDGAISGNADANAMTSGTFATRSGTPDRLYFRNTAYIGKTGNEMKAILSGNIGGASIWYALATPTDTEITNEALVAQLEALAAATMYNPQTNIATLYAEGNEQPTLDVSYFTDKNPDTRDELVIDSRLRTITLNGLDVYHLQAPGSEFLMLAPGENRLALQSDITGDNGYAQVSYKQGYLSI